MNLSVHLHKLVKNSCKSAQKLIDTVKMASNERMEMLKKVEEVSKLNPESLKKIEGKLKLKLFNIEIFSNTFQDGKIYGKITHFPGTKKKFIPI